jgi:hypothetical protein
VIVGERERARVESAVDGARCDCVEWSSSDGVIGVVEAVMHVNACVCAMCRVMNVRVLRAYTLCVVRVNVWMWMERS